MRQRESNVWAPAANSDKISIVAVHNPTWGSPPSAGSVKPPHITSQIKTDLSPELAVPSQTT